MSVIAAQPRKMLNPNATIKMLAIENKKQLGDNMHLSENFRQEMAGILSRRFTLRDDARKVSFCRQMSLIFKRNMTGAIRNPLQLLAVLILGCVQSFMLITLYSGVGNVKLEDFKSAHSKDDLTDVAKKYIYNWLGLVFLASSDQFIICAFAMILLIPMALPVFKREMGNRMYTPAAYFWATTASNICTNIFYPVLVSCLTFWFYGYPIDTFSGFFLFFLVEASGALMGICFGQVIGSIVDNENAAITWLLNSLSVYYLGAGMMINASNANWLGVFFQWISPLRYVNELALRRILAGRPQNM